MGLAKLLSGRISFGERDFSALPIGQLARAGLGYVPQTRNVFTSLTIEENLLASAATEAARERLAFVYDVFPLLKERRRTTLRRRAADAGCGKSTRRKSRFDPVLRTARRSGAPRARR
jgi:ABC-type branched-subunit amino acid transport system ATPase component